MGGKQQPERATARRQWLIPSERLTLFHMSSLPDGHDMGRRFLDGSWR
jgi:hypothetical protein